MHGRNLDREGEARHGPPPADTRRAVGTVGRTEAAISASPSAATRRKPNAATASGAANRSAAEVVESYKPMKSRSHWSTSIKVGASASPVRRVIRSVEIVRGCSVIAKLG